MGTPRPAEGEGAECAGVLPGRDDLVARLRRMLRTDELDFDLPEELIARRPAEPRDASRLMVVSRSDPAILRHLRFADLPQLLKPSDVLVFNTSAVLPARLAGIRADTGGRVAGLFVRADGPDLWRVMLRSNGKLRTGLRVRLHRPERGPDALAEESAGLSVELELVGRAGEAWIVRPVTGDGQPIVGNAERVLASLGATALPPYIQAARARDGLSVPDAQDRAWYQTVYADRRPPGASAGGSFAGSSGGASGGSSGGSSGGASGGWGGVLGSVAAPTAGLHFTPGLLERIEAAGVSRVHLRLHVGLGTFRPVVSETVEGHAMHDEVIDVPGEAVRAVEAAQQIGGRTLCVGTTVVRSLESLPAPIEPAHRERGYASTTSLLITPGHRFRFTDALITNFHLPRSTLLALVAALFPPVPRRTPGGVARVLELYREAIAERYRFFSYGDAMLILP